MENEKIKKYELVVIVDANQTSEAKDAIIKDVTDELTKNGVKVINTEVWLEKQKFTFEIDKHTEGTYYTVNFESDGSSHEAITKILQIKENILRFMIANEQPQPVA